MNRIYYQAMIKNEFLKLIQPLLLILSLASISGCTPMTHPAKQTISSCQIVNNLYITDDGTQLPLKTWFPNKNEVKAIIIALHGFNDYSNFFQQPGNFFSQQNILSYAYDQRGFGESPNRGLWAGIDTYIKDTECFIHLINNKHPDTPIYLLGESMGGAIGIATLAQSNGLPVDGMILAAPAVWSRETMPWYQNLLLWSLSHTLPWLTLSGTDLGIKPSDNIEMLRSLGKDPLIIKETRVESIYGLVNLMDQAISSANLISTSTLLLYGDKDEIIPKQPTYQFSQQLIDAQFNSNLDRHIVAFYQNGYHMLLRDLQASILWNDIAVWINSSNTPLPSGADKRAHGLLKE